MPYLVPPMDPEPPDDYVGFVADNLAAVHSEAARLVDGESHADEVYPEALADVAGRWRRLRLLCRLGRRDATSEFLRRRLSVRAKQWRDDQIYEVDVRVLRDYSMVPAGVGARSLALRKAAVLPGTVRSGVVAVADAGIAWVHAYRRQQWHRVGRLVAFGILLIGSMIQFMSAISADY